jgi:hypothetical protein
MDKFPSLRGAANRLAFFKNSTSIVSWPTLPSSSAIFGFVFRDPLGVGEVVDQLARLKSSDPKTNKVAREVVPACQFTHTLATLEKILGNMALEFQAVRPVTSHGV